MAAKDIYHQTVIDALEKDGWAITHDPLELRYGNRRLKIDLGAERLIGAERNSQKIAVEIKSFLSDSAIYDLENAVGQYNVYREVLALQEPERMLYLAVPQYTYTNGIFDEPLGQLLVEKQRLLLIIFDDNEKEIIKWA